jgi:hypothetical protein
VSAGWARPKSESYVHSDFSLFRHLQAALSTPAVPNCPRWKRVQVRQYQLQRAEGSQHSGIRCYLFAIDMYDTKLGGVGSAERGHRNTIGTTATTGKRLFPKIGSHFATASRNCHMNCILPQTVLVCESPSKVSSLSPFTPDHVDVETSR